MHLLVLLKQTIHILDLHPRSNGNPALAGSINHGRQLSFMRSHGINNRNLPVQLLVSSLLGNALGQLPAHGQLVHQSRQPAHINHLLKLLTQVSQVQAFAFLDLSRQFLGLVPVNLTLDFLNQGEHITHTQDARSHTFRMEALKRLGMRPEDTKVVVQGSGNVGGIGALLMHREGYTITSLSDMYGSIHNPNGLDVPNVLEFLAEKGKLEGFPDAEAVPNAVQLELPCDVLIPAATENTITSKNVDKIKAKLIVEGANGPTTFPADSVLDERGVMVVPDILANAGGVTVSYFEWVQDRMGYFWTEEVVNSRLEQIMVKAFDEVDEVAKKHDVSLRIGSYIHAIGRVAEVYQLRGSFA